MFFLKHNFDEDRLHRWSVAVRRRDGRCLRCNSKKDLEAHHIEPKNRYPKKAYLLDNGATLCKRCHRIDKDSWHRLYGYKRGNKKLFQLWLRGENKKSFNYNTLMGVLLSVAIVFLIIKSQA
jgi:5-methylcytosine-specific restriction endonuclease McrA